VCPNVADAGLHWSELSVSSISPLTAVDELLDGHCQFPASSRDETTEEPTPVARLER
jgi:hypothetical protein